jgi:hypothetical protein
MHSEIIENDFQIKGQGIKFMGTITPTRITGKWHLEVEQGIWQEYITLTLEKRI